MSTRQIWWVALAITVLAMSGFLAFVAYGPERSMELSQSELQEKLDPKFPQVKCILAIACLEVIAPRIHLTEESDRLEVSASFRASLGGKNVPGIVEISGKPRYVQSEGQLFLDDILVRKFALTGGPSGVDEIVRLKGPALIGTLLSAIPIYTLSSNSQYESLAKLILQSVKVVNGKLRLTFARPVRRE